MNRHLNKLFVRACSRLQTQHVWEKPTCAIFEMTSRCNLKRSLCNTGALKDSFPGDPDFHPFHPYRTMKRSEVYRNVTKGAKRNR